MPQDKIQRNQIDKVVEYINQHLSEDLSLEQLAKVSTYSPYHFQRLFKGLIGETPAGYVKRMRLENAAHMLIYEPQLPITQIAFICGFSSLSYFTYSFNTYFKANPKSWREGAYLERFPREYQNSKKSKLFSTKAKASQGEESYNEFKWLDLSKVKIAHFPECSTVNRFHIGSYIEGIPEAWQDLYRWGNARNLIEKSPLIFGVPKSNPYITPPEKSRYECRLAVENQNDAEDEELYLFRGSMHVVYEFDEPVDYLERGKLIECYSELYSYWLPKSGYRYLGNPIELVEMISLKGTLDIGCSIKAIALAIEPN
ncbi:GyrI-like domain-containing protein [Rossellomorea aquimaris]|uniref:AraC family transcriptional regulator n=1 Tax=Rossellomorea aquimaris TaxID=189382 RepID=A0A5D4U4X2_9BACI|nr:helix-turn-helix domain-containing protein [Rossellomorea aquimaris]TYS82139.1 AraC family transcriptional regulator [Rossellomorea aquimaris]TYS88767.1 AraC family transcriptional regulator [Rossellomorea aquimaris]